MSYTAKHVLVNMHHDIYQTQVIDTTLHILQMITPFTFRPCVYMKPQHNHGMSLEMSLHLLVQDTVKAQSDLFLHFYTIRNFESPVSNRWGHSKW